MNIEEGDLVFLGWAGTGDKPEGTWLRLADPGKQLRMQKLWNHTSIDAIPREGRTALSRLRIRTGSGGECEGLELASQSNLLRTGRACLARTLFYVPIHSNLHMHMLRYGPRHTQSARDWFLYLPIGITREREKMRFARTILLVLTATSLFNLDYSCLAEEPGAELAVKEQSFASELQFVPRDALAAVVLRPNKLRSATQRSDLPGLAMLGRLPFELSELESVTAVVVPQIKEGPVGYGFILRFHLPFDAKALVQWISPGASEHHSAEHKFYFPARSEGGQMQVLIPDSRTAILSPFPSSPARLLATGREQKEQTRPLAEWPTHQIPDIHQQFADLKPDAQLAFAFADERLRHIFGTHGEYDASQLSRKIQARQSSSSPEFDWICGTLNATNSKAFEVSIQPESLTADAKSDGWQAWISPLIHGMHMELGLGQDNPTVLEKEFLDATRSMQKTEAVGKLVFASTDSGAADRILGFADRLAKLYQKKQTRKRLGKLTEKSLSQLSIAIRRYKLVNGKEPQDIRDSQGKALLSWRVELLPFLGHQDLYSQFRLNEPWSSVHNRLLQSQMPEVFRSDQTNRYSFDTSFQRPILLTAAAMKSVQEEGIQLLDAPRAVPWSCPVDFKCEQWSNVEQKNRLAVSHKGKRLKLAHSLDQDEFLELVLRGTPATVGAEVSPQRKLTSEELQKLIATSAGDSTDALHSLSQLVNAGEEFPQASTDEVIALLRTRLRSENPWTRRLALLGIDRWKRGARMPRQELAQCALDPYEANRWLAMHLLLECADEEVMQKLATAPDYFQEWTQFALKRRSDLRHLCSSMADSVKSLAYHPSSKVRRSVGALLAWFGREEHRYLLEVLASDSDALVRNTISLVKQDHFPEQGPLEVALKDNKQDLQQAWRSLATLHRSERGAITHLLVNEVDSAGKYRGRLNERELMSLATLRKLKSLRLNSCRVTDDVIEVLAKLPELEELELRNCFGISPRGFVALAELQKLKSLNLSGANIGNYGAEWIGRLSRLEHLNLSDTDVGNRGIAAIARLSNLKSLNLDRTLITDAGLSALRHHTTLSFLSASSSAISDQSLETLLSIKHLRRTNFLFCSFSEEGLRDLYRKHPVLH